MNKKILSIILVSVLSLQSLTAFAQTGCNHKNTVKIDKIEATCTANGYTSGVYCSDCKKYISGHDVISALGHIDADGNSICDDCGLAFTVQSSKKETCTEYGYTGDEKLSNGRIIMGSVIAPSGHVDSNLDFICDKCKAKISKKLLTITLNYYVTKTDYEKNKDKYEGSNFTVKESSQVKSCMYIQEIRKVKQMEEITVPETPVLNRYLFRWQDQNGAIYKTYKFTKNTTLYMAYAENGKAASSGQAGDNIYWIYNEEYNRLLFFGSGTLWNIYDVKEEIPWYDYLADIDGIWMESGIVSKVWLVTP